MGEVGGGEEGGGEGMGRLKKNGSPSPKSLSIFIEYINFRKTRSITQLRN